MKKLEESKRVYEAVRVPEELPAAVHGAMRQAREKERRFERSRRWRYAACAAAALCVAFVVALNAVPVLAQELYSIPVVGQMARVFTLWRYEEAGEDSYIRVTMPAIENTGNTALEKRLNQEIAVKVQETLTEAKARAKDYYEAYLETGGDKDEYLPMEIVIDYEIKCNNGQVVSFLIREYESHASFYEETAYYNIDMDTGKELTLRDMLGEDYIALASEAVHQGIEADEAANPEEQYYHDELAFQIIDADQPFYINEEGHVVVVFGKYEIAPGYMGAREFEVLP